MPLPLILMIYGESLTLDKPPVVNASPLIYLSKAGLITLLQLLHSEIFVPEKVATEILQRGKSDISAKTIEETSWLRVIETPDVPSIIQSWDLGVGESSVLTWAYANPKTEAVIDDLAARRCAAALEIPIRGTLGLVLVAKQRGEVSSARQLLDRLKQAGMYLSDSVMNRALALVDE
jgi:predicted nucleic acid-binding protein